jgi:hypothetical protein
MRSLAESQSAFAMALFDPALPVPNNLRSLDKPAGPDRFAVYRNNVMVALIEGLRDAYPVVCRLVGDEFFRAMAAVFVRAHPPHSPVMLEYGDGFAQFIAEFPPAAGLPYLPDVARLERAWVEAYHAPEAEPLSQVPCGTGHTFALHPATRLVRSPFPVLAIWEANRSDSEPHALELSAEGDDVLVTRPAAEVQAFRISGDAAEAVQAMKTGETGGADEHFCRLCPLGALTARECAA